MEYELYFTDIFLKILAIINYTGDREKALARFLGVSRSKAFLSIADELPTDEQEKIKETMSSAKKPEQVEELIKRHYDLRTYKENLKQTLEQEVLDYLAFIAPTLRIEQRENINRLFFASD